MSFRGPLGFRNRKLVNVKAFKAPPFGPSPLGPFPWSRPQLTVFVMSRALAVATTILTILQSYHDSYVSAQAPTCLPGYSWVR